MKPFVFVNIASSIDGKISDESRKQVRISCREDFQRVDRLRAFSDAIMVGIGTVLSDDPSLTVKDERLRYERVQAGKDENPIRVVVDSRLRIPLNAKILDDRARTIVATTEKGLERVKLIEERAEVVVFGREKVDLRLLCEYLYKIGVRRLMVEGGGTLINSLLREKMIDEFNIYYGNMIIGGRNSPTVVDGESFADPVRLELISCQKLGEGIFTRWRVVYR
ncbi:2,5-diamino-6-(5-phosphoribosylamino)pyrimidin-4(3H)-one reductase [Archaeoglobus sulfaticallidus PM70-1]|uniref:2,5-diamino-6-(ribosylamino)-4(3H)-pyrimidinone 5'-phosphate reductase n=1 Tax=Archaeoglobus sulfaticallidus PM70-1 TaxID=387631 RepID=N0BB00_9EURY|nr:2,5-diamino-6-(ribosylamino)-4(3H)-pyrimidinone 5'-phosphate reductase [Archaeoglobus sulfaticallidus]AGK60784.1 2,5-diamino-6-(5-phosphoribosylamino)pyrimidin-4(3H)-one reductase [Archaeoglobus sulfaticallidus PM70-1]